jgi:hypothetical protein
VAVNAIADDDREQATAIMAATMPWVGVFMLVSTSVVQVSSLLYLFLMSMLPVNQHQMIIICQCKDTLLERYSREVDVFIALTPPSSTNHAPLRQSHTSNNNQETILQKLQCSHGCLELQAS